MDQHIQPTLPLAVRTRRAAWPAPRKALRRFADPLYILAGASIAVVATLVVPPFFSLINGSLHVTAPDGSFGPMTLQNFVDVFHGRELIESGVNSFVFALGATLFALLAGASQAWIVERTDAPLKLLAYIGAVMALATPYILYVLGFLFLFSRVGPVNEILKWLMSTRTPPLNVNSLWGMTLIEGVLWVPFVFLMLAPVFRLGNSTLEEAALACGASRAQTLYRVTLRLAAPAVFAVLLLVFVRTLEAFEVPILVGLPSKVNVLTTDIYLQLKMQASPDFGRANAFAVLLVVVVVVLLSLYHRVLRHAEKYQTVTGKAYRLQIMKLGWGRWLAALVLLLNFILCVVLPIGMLVWVSLSPFYQAISARAFSLLTLKNYQAIASHTEALEAVGNTLLVSAATATVVMAIAAVAGWLIGRKKPASRLLDLLSSLPLVFPGVVLALAALQIFINFPLAIYGTLWIMLIAFTARYVPYGVRYSTIGVVQLHRELEEAASASGASLGSVLMRVVRPLINPALLSGWLFVFLLTARDLVMPVMLSGPSSHMVAEQLYLQWVDGHSTELAALGLAWTMLMTVVAMTFYLLTRSFSASPTR